MLVLRLSYIAIFKLRSKNMAEQKRIFNRIKSVLAEKRKTNNWLAETLNVSKTTVSKWCTNDMQPGVETLFDIADALDVDVRELLVSNKAKG
jgi:transcriptional regulator with XRE-family HTH domain